MFKPISKTKNYKQIKPVNINGAYFMMDNENYIIIKETNSFILCSPENTDYVLYVIRNKFYECFELIEDEVEVDNNQLESKSEFEVGDMVKITNKYNHENSTAGASYSYYPSFFQENGFYELKNRYVEKGVKNGIYNIFAIGRHSLYPNPIVYVLEKDNEIYLMSNTYNEMGKVKENNIMTQNNNQLQTYENLYARLGDTLILSNGLKLKVCKDFCDRDTQYYKTVDISCNTNVTIGYSEKDIKKLCIGKKVWGYGTDEFEIVDIERKQVKVNKVKVEQNVNTNSKQKVFTYEMIPHSVHWKVKYNNKIIDQETDSGSESYKLITNGNNTIIILDDGCKGFAKCLPSDEYNLDKGIDIAYTKALIKSYQKKLKELVK